MISEPEAKINWSELIEETENFVRKNWPEVDSEYNGRHCSSIQIVDPFTGDDITLGERAKRASEVETVAPKPFKTYKDYADAKTLNPWPGPLEEFNIILQELL